jgi:hypothetical protein
MVYFSLQEIREFTYIEDSCGGFVLEVNDSDEVFLHPIPIYGAKKFYVT